MFTLREITKVPVGKIVGKLVKYWNFRIVVQVGTDPKVLVYDWLGMSLKNQASYQGEL